MVIHLCTNICDVLSILYVLSETPIVSNFYVMWDQQQVWDQCTCMFFNPPFCCLRFVTTLMVDSEIKVMIAVISYIRNKL